MRPQGAINNRSPVESDYPVATVTRLAILGLGILAILSWLFLAFAHLDDRFNVNAVSGTLLALADRARDGVLYPPLFDGQSYGGTRTMPLPILLYSFAISLGGGLLAPAKIVDLLASVGLVLLLVAILRRQGAPTILAVGLASTVVTSQVFLLAATGIRPESLPTALQLAAVALVGFVPRRAATGMAGVLCAIAILAKVSALWAPAAIVVWLLIHDRARLLPFGIGLGAGLVVLLGTFTVATDGRMLANLVGLGGAGLTVIGVLKAPLKAVELLVNYAQATFVLLPALLGLWLVARAARPTLVQFGLVAAAGILLIAMADVGSDYNHLLDVVVLTPIAALELARNLAHRVGDARLAWSYLAAAILVGSAASLALNAGSSLAGSLALPGASPQASYDPNPFAAELRGADSVLSEDPYVNLSRGERPTVADPFMFVRIAQREPGLVEPLLSSVNDERFDAIVLIKDLADPAAVGWYRDFAFGLPFYDAMRDNYHLCAAGGGFFLYFPKAHSCPT